MSYFNNNKGGDRKDQFQDDDRKYNEGRRNNNRRNNTFGNRGRNYHNNHQNYDNNNGNNSNTRYNNRDEQNNNSRNVPHVFSEEVLAKLKQLSIVTCRHPQYLPISTRGIGFAISITNKLLVQSFPKIPAPNVHCLYRISLMQLHLKMYLASHQQIIKRNSHAHRPNVTSDAKNSLMSHPANLSILCSVINQIGNIVNDGNEYYPTFLDCTSPAHIHIENLRDYVVRMSDPATARQIRNRGYNFNPIPGAMWNNLQPNGEDWILINPDDIMPPNYGKHQIDCDLIEISGILTSFSRKMPKLAGMINFNGKGHPGQLVSSRLAEMSINNDQKLLGDIREFHSREKLELKVFASGILGMFGEVDEDHYVSYLRCVDAWSCSLSYTNLLSYMSNIYL